MDRLSLILTLATGPVLTGVFVITALTLGLYGWAYIGPVAALGWLLSWPAAYLISRRIKRADPAFDHTHARHTGLIPDPAAPEV